MSLPLVTRFGADPVLDLEVANKQYVDSSGGGATVTTQIDGLASTFTTVATSPTDITGLLITLPTRTDGHFFCTISGSVANNAVSGAIRFLIDLGGTDGKVMGNGSLTANARVVTTVSEVGELNGDVLQARGYVASGTGSWFSSTHNDIELNCLEVS